jgi:hypothetical protein
MIKRKINAATEGITKAARETHDADDVDPAKEYVPILQETQEVLPANGELEVVWPSLRGCVAEVKSPKLKWHKKAAQTASSPPLILLLA